MSRHDRSTSASEEDGMEQQSGGLGRRGFLKAVGLGALGTALSGGMVGGWCGDAAVA